ncbi:MAG: capsular biosynthesis protein [Caulobacter sp.]|nr:capsular biosynthesis protein [Caulobacter sp.]
MDVQVHDAAAQPSAPSGRAGGAFDLTRVVSIFRRRLRLFAAVAIVVLAVAVVITFQLTPRYLASADVMIDTRTQDVVKVDAVMGGLPADTNTVDTEVEVLRSRSLAEKVVAELGLDRDAEFNPSLAPPGLLSFLRPTPPPSGAAGVLASHEAVVDGVLAGLKIRRAGLTYLINVGFESVDPVKAAKIANAFADNYIETQLSNKFEANQAANEWLNKRLVQLRQEVLDNDTAVEQYKIANNLMSAQGATLTEGEITGLDQQLATTKASEAEAVARLNTARAQMARGSNGEDVGEALDSPVIQHLRQQRATVSASVADLQGRYGEKHPEMLKAKRQLADIDAQIQAEIKRIISNLEAQAQVARQRTASIQGSVSSSKGALAGNNRASVRLNELQRNADASKALYESFLNRFKETSAQTGIEKSDARIVSHAKIPSQPDYPNKPLNLALGLILALGAGLAALMLAEALDSGLTTADDIENQLDLPSLGAIPLLSSTLEGVKGKAARLSPVSFVVEKPMSAFAESFRNLRASIVFSKVGEPVKVIAITSSLPGEGKTTTSLCLARTIALAGSSVIVVDCDLRQKAVNDFIKGEVTVGLVEVLNGDATLEQALVNDEATGAVLLPLAKPTYTAKDIFSSDAMHRLLQELRRRYDVIILDTAPVLPIADTRMLAPQADVVVLLARWRKTPRKAIENSLRLLASGGAYIAGAALTQVDMKQQSRYGYGDPGYYYRSYKKYYG